MSSVLRHYLERPLAPAPLQVEGQVTDVVGMLIEGNARSAAVGDLYKVEARDGEILAEVVALKGQHVILMPFGHLAGLKVGARLRPAGGDGRVPVGDALRGRVIDAFGRPIDSLPPPLTQARGDLRTEPLRPFERASVDQRMSLGVRALDAFVPCGRGQRLGIFAGPGVGKSVLLGMIAKATSADVTVLALVGERGREVGHFVEKILGEAGLRNAVVVVATSDRPAPERVRAALTATTIAESFRDQGKNVLLFVDSLTRFCMAQREIGLAVGEPPTTKGYPPSAFALLPQLLERAAPKKGGGSVTGLYTVLVEGDDLTDPVGDAARGLLDGHIVLSRRLAERGNYPAIDILQSLSRVESDVTDGKERDAARRVRAWLSRLEDARDLLAMGAYRPGSDRDLDEALRRRAGIVSFLQQSDSERANLPDTRRRLIELAGEPEVRT